MGIKDFISNIFQANSRIELLNRRVSDLHLKNSQILRENSVLKTKISEMNLKNSKILRDYDEIQKINKKLLIDNAKIEQRNSELGEYNKKTNKIKSELIGKNEQLEKNILDLSGQFQELQNIYKTLEEKYKNIYFGPNLASTDELDFLNNYSIKKLDIPIINDSNQNNECPMCGGTTNRETFKCPYCTEIDTYICGKHFQQHLDKYHQSKKKRIFIPDEYGGRIIYPKN
jgi:DNA repair exonuclease SbcCD ATPase subunit